MSNLKFITEPWVDFPEGETEALYLDVDRQYTIEEIKEQVNKVCDYYIDYNVEAGYEAYTETRYRKKGSWY